MLFENLLDNKIQPLIWLICVTAKFLLGCKPRHIAKNYPPMSCLNTA